jgi:hypothetical protein
MITRPDLDARWTAHRARMLEMGKRSRRLRRYGEANTVVFIAGTLLVMCTDWRRTGVAVMSLAMLSTWRWVTLSQRELRALGALTRETATLAREALEGLDGELQPDDKLQIPPGGSI